MTTLERLSESKAVYAIVLEDAKDRKALHEFLKTIPGVGHKSIFCPGVSLSEQKEMRLIKCGGEYGQRCSKYINLTGGEYHYGVMENNKDEYYNVTCSKCGYIRTFEPNYEYDKIKYVPEPNVVVFGTQVPPFRRTKTWKKVPRSLSEMVHRLRNRQIHEIPPFKLPFRRRMQAIVEHVTEALRPPSQE